MDRKERVLIGIGTGIGALALAGSLKFAADANSKVSDMEATMDAFRAQRDNATTIVMPINSPLAPTDTLMPTLTKLPPTDIPPSLDPLFVTVTAMNKNLESTATAQAQTATLEPGIGRDAVRSDVEPTASPETIIDPNTIQRRERDLNSNLDKNTIGVDVNITPNEYLKKVTQLNTITDSTDADSGTGNHINANTTSMINPPMGNNIGNLGQGGLLHDYQREYGLDFSFERVSTPAVTEFDAISNQNIAVLQVETNQNDGQLFTGRLIGFEDDTLTVYEAAAAILIKKEQGKGNVSDISSNDISTYLTDKNNANKLISMANEIYGQIEHTELPVGQNELERRNSNNINDGDVLLKSIASHLPLHSDQAEVCLVQLTTNTVNRQNQQQYTIKSKFIENGQNTPTEMNGERRPVELQIAAGFTENGYFVWDVDRHDDGAIQAQGEDDSAMTSSTGNETLPCATGTPAQSTPVPTVPGQTAIPTVPGQTLVSPSETPFQITPTLPQATPTQEWPTPMPTNQDLFTQVPSPVATTSPNDIPPTNAA